MARALSMTPDAIRKRAQRAQYKALEQQGKDWDARNPDACPDCKGRPGKADYADEGGGDHAPWCKA